MGVKRTLLIGAMLVFFGIRFCHAQKNLVLNYSFESQYCGLFGFNCTTSTIDYWNGSSLGSPDPFSTCQPQGPGTLGVPQNGYGYQSPRTGLQYVGVGIESSDFEYIQGKTINPLVARKKYCINYYISLADSMNYAISDLGIYLSDTPFCIVGSLDTMPYFPQIVNPVSNLLTDKINWVPLSGEYTAQGGEQYITIGKFNSKDSYIYVGGGSSNFSMIITYYYIDDVSVREIAEAHAGNDTNICNDGYALLGTDSAVGGVKYSWAPTLGLANPNSPQTLASPSVTTTYTLTVVNDSMKGCRCPDSVNTSTVTVNVCQEPLFVPTAFSPNGDGQNDILLIKGNYIATMDFIIYDRWGNKVFESENQNNGWDGTYKGQPQNAGTYVYYLSGTYANGTTFNKKGNVSLVR